MAVLLSANNTPLVSVDLIGEKNILELSFILLGWKSNLSLNNSLPEKKNSGLKTLDNEILEGPLKVFFKYC